MTQRQLVTSAQLGPDGCWINHRELPFYLAEQGPSFDAEPSILWLPLLVEPGPTAVNYAPLSERRLLASLTVNTPLTRKGEPAHMSEDTNTAHEQDTTATERDDTSKDTGRTFTQDEVNRLLAKERRDQEARFAGYDELKAKAAKFDEVEEDATRLEAVRASRKRKKPPQFQGFLRRRGDRTRTCDLLLPKQTR